MEFDELLITTGVDALVRLVKEKQRVELEEAASVLNIATETLEDWARVLEEEGILRLEYRLTRIYLLWVRPTEEEVSAEVASFREERAGIEKEVAEFRKKAAKEGGGLDDLRQSFAEFYAKAYPKMEKLERAVAVLPAGKTISEDVMAKQAAATLSFSGDLEAVKKGLAELKKELASFSIDRGEAESKKRMERIDRMHAELQEAESQLQEIRKRAAQAAPQDVSMPSALEMKRKFESIKKDFAELKNRNAKLREDMLSLQESSEILRTVAEAIMGHEGKVQELHEQMTTLSAEADRLMEKVRAVSATAKQNLELAERFGDSITVAKGILTRFPSQQKVLEELDRLKASEDAALEKVNGVEKLLEAAGGKQVTARQFTDLTKKMDERSVQLRRDLDALAATLEDEKATYLAFQKIREKVVPSIEAYQKQLDEMETRTGRMRQEMAAQQEGMRADAKKLQESLRGGELQGAVKLAEDIREKKRMLDEVKEALDELTNISDNLAKRITLLSREASLLEIRTGGGAGAVTETKKEELKQQLELSEAEELEFRKKREELKNLIRKLWEQS